MELFNKQDIGRTVAGVALLGLGALAGCTDSTPEVTQRGYSDMLDPYVNAARQVNENLANGLADSTVTHGGMTYKIMPAQDGEILRVKITGYQNNAHDTDNDIRRSTFIFGEDSAQFTVQPVNKLAQTMHFDKKYGSMVMREAGKGKAKQVLGLFKGEVLFRGKANERVSPLKSMDAFYKTTQPQDVTGNTLAEWIARASLE